MNKISRLALFSLIAVFLITSAYPSFAAPKKINANGFNEFGYNYKARLFKGWFGYYDKDIIGGFIAGTGDARLVMKWSKNWTPMADEPIGAWTTNHMTWYSNDYEEGSWYGWDSRLVWDSRTPPESAYKINEFLKIMKVGDNLEEWNRYQEGGAYNAGWGNYESGVPKYVVFQDVIEVLDAKTGEPVTKFELSTGSPKGLGHPIF